MPFSNPRNAATSYLVLRHLYDGDVIEWPLPDSHPMRMLFDNLERSGFIARWNRIWPLTDRYRLTEKGIATLEAMYRPNGAETFFERIQAQNLPAALRRAQLQAAHLDPMIWPVLHDPHTHWSSFYEDPGRYYRFFWEDQIPPTRIVPAVAAGVVAGMVQRPGLVGDQQRPYDRHHPHGRDHGVLVDLDNDGPYYANTHETYSDADIS